MRMMLDAVVVGYRPGWETARMLADLHECAESFFHLYYFDNTLNKRSLTACWNDLAREGHSEFVAFLNPDVIPCPSWDRRLTEALTEHPKVGVAIPCPLSSVSVTYLDKHFTIGDPPTRKDMINLSDWATEKGVGRQHLYDFGNERGHMFSAIFRRTDFDELRGFDERLPFYGQDHEIQDRLVARGFKCAQVRTCPFWNGKSIPTNIAIKEGTCDLSYEQGRMASVLLKIRNGQWPRWDTLTDGARASIRRDKAFQMGLPDGIRERLG